MQVEVVVRNIGNSKGIVFPAAALKDMGLQTGQTLLMDTEPSGNIILSPKRKYKLADLLALCDLKAEPPADLAVWDAAVPVGQEIM
jgi:antitoxin ChpS